MNAYSPIETGVEGRKVTDLRLSEFTNATLPTSVIEEGKTSESIMVEIKQPSPIEVMDGENMVSFFKPEHDTKAYLARDVPREG